MVQRRTLRKSLRRRQRGRGLFSDAYSWVKSKLGNLVEGVRNVKKMQPLSTIDKYLSKDVRSGLLGMLPGGGVINDIYDSGIQLGFRRRRKRRAPMKKRRATRIRRVKPTRQTGTSRRRVGRPRIHRKKK